MIISAPPEFLPCYGPEESYLEEIKLSLYNDLYKQLTENTEIKTNQKHTEA